MIKVRLVKKIEGIEVQNGDTITLGLKVGMAGASAYQSYLATTTDDPKLTEAEWSASFDGLESVTSTDNHIVVDNTDPKNPSLSFQTVDNENFVTDDELAVVQATSGTNTGDQDLSDLQPKIGVTLETTATTIEAAINEVRTIALGYDIAYVFDTEADMNAWLLIPANVAKLQVGNLFLIRETTVPDYWWDGVSALELEVKIDLTNYYTKSEIDTNFRNETQDTIGDLIELTELETVTDTTKIAASDSAFLKWFSGATLKTFLSFTFAKIVDYFSKTESDRRFVNQNGGTIYHITRWFTPTSALTIAANGLSATITSGQFTASMTGAKLRLTSGVNEPIITFVNSNNITLSYAVDASFFGQSVAVADWGVYKFVFGYGAGSIDVFLPSGGRSVQFIDSYVYAYPRAYANGFLLFESFLSGNKDFKFLFSGTTNQNDTKDTALFRSSAGRLKIYDGITTTERRDLELRSLFADKIIPNSDTTGVVIRNAADTSNVFELTTDLNNSALIPIKTGQNGAAYGFKHSNGDISGFYYDYDEIWFKRRGTQCFGIGPNQVLEFRRNVNVATGYKFGINTGLFAETTIDVNGTTTLRDWVYLNNGTHTGDSVGDKRFKITSGVLIYERCTVLNATRGSGTWVTDLQINAEGVLMPKQAASAPTYVKGGMYFDTTLNKMRIGGATDWETLTSV